MARNNILTRSLRKRADNLFSENRHAEAAIVFEKICATDPNDTDARIMLAITKISTGEFRDAEEHCLHALRINPGHALGHHVLGTVQQRKGDIHEAVIEFRHAVRLRPDFANAHLFLANALTELGKYKEAESGFQEALRLTPALPGALAGLGRLYTQTGQLSDAETYIRKALQHEPENTEYLVALSELLCTQGKPDKALPILQQRILTEPDSYSGNYALGMVFTTLGRYDDAIRHYQKAREIKPNDEFATGAIAGIMERRGDFDDARELLWPLINAGSTSAGVVFPFAELACHFGNQTEATSALMQVLTNPSLDHKTRTDTHFKLGKLLDATGNYDQAFSHYKTANDLLQQTNAGQADSNTVEQQTRRVLRSINTRKSDGWSNAAATGNTSELPVFIVGMPRSGTTLVEQILASHPDIHGAGELNIIENIAGSICRNASDYPACLQDIPQSSFQEEAARCLIQLEDFSTTAKRIVDKFPHNFLHLGLITRLFPKAKIIHISRDARDTCLSIYFQVFSPRHAYSCNLAQIGKHYRDYEQVMLYWNATLHDSILNIRYEQLVSEPASTVKALIEHCGLPWDDRCLSFHTTERDVNTPSYDQVRKPLYLKSVDRWKNYAGHINALTRALSEEASESSSKEL